MISGIKFFRIIEWNANFCTLIGVLFFTISTFVSAQTISSGGEHSLFLCRDGSVMSTGRNVWGELGDGTGNNMSHVVNVKSGTSTCAINLCDITAVSKGGFRHSLFLKNDGTVWACGNNYSGELGNGTNANAYSPVQVKAGTSNCVTNLCNITAVSTGYNHSLFLKDDGTVWACGENIAGQLGDGTTINKNTPVQVIGISGVIAISAGGRHSLFLKNDGTVWACGVNSGGELGDGTNTDKLSPIQVTAITGSITAISAGESHSLFLKNDGTVWACGYNNKGQLGDGTITGIGKTSPVQVIAGTSGCSTFLCNIIGISAGGEHSVFLKSDRTVLSCGNNSHGQLGDGTMVDKSSPVLAIGLASITDIAAGYSHSVFRKNDHTVLACGNNNSGQLGDGSLLDKNSAVLVSGLCAGGTTSVESNYFESDKISIYPNPNNGTFTITLLEPTNSVRVEVYTSLGALVYKNAIVNQQTAINLTNQTSGLYFIKVLNDNGIVATKKIIKY